MYSLHSNTYYKTHISSGEPRKELPSTFPLILSVFCFYRFFTFFISDITYFDIRLLPRDKYGNVLFPQIPKSRGILFIFYFACLFFNLSGFEPITLSPGFESGRGLFFGAILSVFSLQTFLRVSGHPQLET